MDKTKKSRQRNASTSSEDPIFNDWLETKLRSAYSSVLDEPIPDDLINLLHQKLKD